MHICFFFLKLCHNNARTTKFWMIVQGTSIMVKEITVKFLSNYGHDSPYIGKYHLWLWYLISNHLWNIKIIRDYHNHAWYFPIFFTSRSFNINGQIKFGNSSLIESRMKITLVLFLTDGNCKIIGSTLRMDGKGNHKKFNLLDKIMYWFLINSIEPNLL